MTKSRVEKNKELYNDIELESFEVEDLADMAKEEPKEEKEEEKRHEMVQVEPEKPVEEEPAEEEVEEEEPPLSYTDRLSVEELLRAKLEKQEKLKASKRVQKRSPVARNYSAKDMQKNISQVEGVDVRKEVNIRVRKNNNGVVFALFMALILVLVAGGVALYFILR